MKMIDVSKVRVFRVCLFVLFMLFMRIGWASNDDSTYNIVDFGTPVIMNGQQTQVLKYKDTEADIQGWSMRKYNPLKSTVNELNLGVGINMYLMRLADEVERGDGATFCIR